MERPLMQQGKYKLKNIFDIYRYSSTPNVLLEKPDKDLGPTKRLILYYNDNNKHILWTY